LFPVRKLRRREEHVQSFGLSLDMVQLPLSSRPIEAAESPNILLGKEPERQREIDSICGLIERLAAAGIPAAKYNLCIIGIPRTEREEGRGGSRNAAFRWRHADQTAPPGKAGILSEEENWSGSTISSAPSSRLRPPPRCASPAIRTTPTRRPAIAG
jgi:mannonate dehydratase